MTLSPARADALAPIPRSICLAGADGAGKSTQAERLARWLTAEGHAVTVCTIWDLLDQSAPGAIPFGSKRDVDRFLAGLHPDGRAMFLHMAMREALDRACDRRGDGFLLVVGYWLKYNATERVYGADPALLDHLAAAFPPLEHQIFLTLSPEAALARKAIVSGYESAQQGKAGFVDFQGRVQAYQDAWCRSGWHHVDGSLPPDAVEAQIRALMAPALEAVR